MSDKTAVAVEARVNGAVTQPAVGQPSYEALLARVKQLEAEKPKAGELTIRINEKNADGTEGKGGISVYGLGRFPLTAYAEQWERLLTPQHVERILTLCKSPKASRKG